MASPACGMARLFRSAPEHHQRSPGEQGQPQRRLAAQLLVEHQAGEGHGYQNPQLVDGNHYSLAFPVINTIAQAITSTTPVRIAVARLESTPLTPSLPRMAVRLANTADPKA